MDTESTEPESTESPGRGSEVVVGVDGSHASRAALRFAASEARMRGDALVVLTATVGAALAGAVSAGATAPAEGMSSLMTGLMAPVVHATLRHFPAPVELARELARKAVQDELGAAEVTVRIEPYEGRPAEALVERSASADLLVVGAAGEAGLGFGSVADQVRRHATCTVVVVPRTLPAAASEPPGTSARSVVVGVDGSAGARFALRFAAHEARLRAAKLVVVSAGHPSDHPAVETQPTPASHEPPDQASQPTPTRNGIERMVAEEPEAASVDATVTLEPGRAATVLLDTARRLGAELLVVGSRGLGGFSGLLLGSVSEAVSRHAPCPVAVVRARAT